MYSILESGIERLRILALDAISDLVNFADETTSLATRPLQGQIGDLVPGTGPTLEGIRGVKHKGIVQLKADLAAQERKMQTIHRNIERLSDLARLCDYMFCASLLAVARAAMAEIVNLVSQPPKKFGFFSILLCLGSQPRIINLSPSVDDIMNGISDLDNAMCVSLNSLPRILHSNRCKRFVHPGITGLVLTQVLETDAQLLSSRRGCHQVLQNDFTRASEFAKEFAELWAIKLHTSSFDLVRGLKLECSNENRTVELLNSAKLIKRELQILKKYGGDLERKKMASSFGTLQVDGRTLRANLASAIDGCIDIIRDELHELARGSCAHALAEFSAHLKMLQRRPNSLKEFAAFIESKAIITAQVRNLYQLSTAVDEMYRSLASIEVRVAAAEHVKLDDLHVIHGKFVETLSNADSDCASRMPIMSQALDKSVAALNDELLNALTALHSGIYDNPESSTKVVLRELGICSENIDALEEKIKVFVHYQTIFKLSPYDFGYLKTVRDYCLDRIDVWSKLDAFRSGVAKLYDTPFDSNVSSAFRILIEHGVISAALAVKKNDSDKIALKFMAEVKFHAMNSDIIDALGNRTLQPRHWKSIFEIIGMSVVGDRLPKFRELQKYKLDVALAAIADISASASGEHTLQLQLAEVEAKLPMWTLEFASDGTVKNFSTLISEMEAAIFALKGMSLSRFSEIVSPKLHTVTTSVELYHRIISSMDALQQLWIILRGVMESPEADVIMPVERASFIRVDGVWKELLLRTSRRNPQVQALVMAKDSVGIETKLLEYTRILEICRLKLEQFVDIKCQAFPRLQFLDRSHVVELLSCGALVQKNMSVYQAAVRACFPGVEELQFQNRREADGAGWIVIGVKPVGAKNIPLISRVLVVGAVDSWFSNTLMSTRETLQSATHAAIAEHCHANEENWMLHQPIQCISLALKVIMQQSITNILLQREDASITSSQALNELASEYDQKCMKLSNLLAVDSLCPMDQLALVTGLLLAVHFRDTSHHLNLKDCSALDDFEWMSTMRMYLVIEDDNIPTFAMKLFDFAVPYGFDVTPGDSLHVITPQTTRVNLGILSALRSNCFCHELYGANGCGKMFLIQNLAFSLGKAFVPADVNLNTNCDSIPLLMTAAKSSSVWIAFKNFHAWSIQLISRFSQTLLAMLADIHSSGPAANNTLNVGKSLYLDASRGEALIFLTSASSSAQSTSSALSSIVGQIFRPALVAVPHEFPIAEAYFLARGFASARLIAKKVQHLFAELRLLIPYPNPQLNVQLLSSVAALARQLKGSGEVSQALEIECVGAAVRMIILPRYPSELVSSLVEPQMNLLFPPIASSIPLLPPHSHIHAELMKSAFSAAQMTWSDSMSTVAVQFCSVIQVSTCVALIGSSCSGKTSLITIASAFMSANKPRIETISLNPNYCANQLFAFRSPNGIVADGLLQLALKSDPVAVGQEIISKWLHLDGDITSTSDAIISFGPLSKMLQLNPDACSDRVLFETPSLLSASPSLVSKLGIVYCPPKMLSYTIFLGNMVKEMRLHDTEAQQQVSDLTLDLLPRLFQSLCFESYGSDDADMLRRRQLTATVLHLITVMFTPQACSMRPSARANLFVFCVFWGLAGGIERGFWDSSEGWLENDAALQYLGSRLRNICCTAALLPATGHIDDLHEYFVSEMGDWCRWDTFPVDPYVFRGGSAFYVPTSRTAPQLYILTNVMTQGHHAMMIGSTGSGKSCHIDALTAKLSATMSLPPSVQQYSFATYRPLSREHTTSASSLDIYLRNFLDLSEAGTFHPLVSSNLMVIVDDMSSCPENSRTTLNACLRQFCGSRGHLGCMYDSSKCGVLRRITCTRFLVTASNGEMICKRTARYLVPVRLRSSTENHLTCIFEAIGMEALTECVPDVRCYMKKLMTVTVSVYQKLSCAAAKFATKLFPLPHPSDCLKVLLGCASAGSANTGSVKSLQKVWMHEMCRVFRDRFGTVGFSDFDALFKETCLNTLGIQVTETNISQLWTRFHSIDDSLYAPVTNLDIAIDLLHARMSEFHKKHKERISLVLDRSSVSAIAFIVRVLQQPHGHCCLIDHDHASSRSLCFFSGYVAGFSVIEMPAVDHSAPATAFLRAAAAQCVEGDTRLVLVIQEEVLALEQVPEIVAALSQGDALAVFERHTLLQLSRKLSASRPVSVGSTLQLTVSDASESLLRNLKIILIGSSSPLSPIAHLPHVASMFTFHANHQIQSDFFSAALQSVVGTGFAEFSVGDIQAQVISDALTTLRDVVIAEAEKMRMSTSMKQKLAGRTCCFLAVQVFHSEVIFKSQTLTDRITVMQQSLASCLALRQDSESNKSRIVHLQQQLDHARIGHQDISMTCNDLRAAVAFTSRTPPGTSSARGQLNSFADHLLFDILTKPVDLNFAECVGEILLIMLDAPLNESNDTIQNPFLGASVLSVIKDSLKKKGCIAKEDSRGASWILEGISRYADVKPDSIFRLQHLLMKSSIQAVYNSGRDSIDELDVCLVEFFVSLHNSAREQELQNAQTFLETSIRKEIELQSSLDDIIAANAALMEMCNSLRSVEEKWKSDLELLLVQQNRLVGDSLQIAVQLVWGVNFPPGCRETLVKNASDSLSLLGIDAVNSINDLNICDMHAPFNVFEALVTASLVHERLGLEWTICYDPDQRLLPVIQRYLQSNGSNSRLSSLRSDDPSFSAAIERCINDGHIAIVHLVDSDVPHLLLDIVRIRTLQVFGRPCIRIGSRMLEAHRNFKLVIQLSMLRFDDVPEIFSSCRSIDLTLHSDSLSSHLAAALKFGCEVLEEQTPLNTFRVTAAQEAVTKCESRIMLAINNPSIRIQTTFLPLIESASTSLSELQSLQMELKVQTDYFSQLPVTLMPHKDFARGAACMLMHLRAIQSISPEAGCTLERLIIMCLHIVIELKVETNELLPTLFHCLSHHLSSVHRLIFALLFACARDDMFIQPELNFLHLSIESVSFSVEGFENPGTRDLDWLPSDVWSRLIAFTSLPGVGVDVLKSLRTRAQDWKKWYQSIFHGEIEQFPDGFSKKITPLQAVCLARCFAEQLLQPMLRQYVKRILGVTYDESRFDFQSIVKSNISIPYLIKEHKVVRAMSAVLEMREAIHGDDSICCFVADGSDWPGLISNVAEHLSAGRWVVVHCMAAITWNAFSQLYKKTEKYHNMSSSRLFIVHTAICSLPRDAIAMCLHFDASLPMSPGTLFQNIYSQLGPRCTLRSNSTISVSDSFKLLASSRCAIFELTCMMVLAAQHSSLYDEGKSFDLCNKSLIKAVGARCASAANALFRRSREFPIANIPRGYTHATVEDIISEGLKEIEDWTTSTAVHRFKSTVLSILGSSAPNLALREQGGSDLLQHMAGLRWPSTLQQLKVDLSRFIAIQNRDGAQLRSDLQSIPCLQSCRIIPEVPFDAKQLEALLDLFPPQLEWVRKCDSDKRITTDGFAECVHNVASVELSHVCNIIQQLWALVDAARKYAHGFINASEFSYFAHNSSITCHRIQAFSIFTPFGIAVLREVVENRVLPQYYALKSAAKHDEIISLGAFSEPYRLISAVRWYSARKRNAPVETLRIRVSVVLDKTAVLSVRDILCPNAIWSTNKIGNLDSIILGSRSMQSFVMGFFIDTDTETVKSSSDGAASEASSIPFMLQSGSRSWDFAADRFICLVDARLDGVNPLQLQTNNVYLAVQGF